MELLVYKASAGSGKTFTLAVQYIRHLILNPKAYRQILAVTFTNKATAEMKERILSQLYGIWTAHPDSRNYLHVLRSMLPPELDEEEIRLRAGQALQSMIHDYSRFRVETIDSFFQSVMRNLGRELELTPGLNIELDTGRILSEAVQHMMEKLTPESPVLAWLLEYIGERISQDKRWNVTREIEAFGRHIFSEEYIARGAELRRKLEMPDYLKLYKESLLTMQEDAIEQMKSFGEQFDERLADADISPDELKRGRSGIAGYFRKLGEGKLSDKDVLTASVAACMERADEWVSKSSKRRNEIMHVAQEHLMPLLHDAEKYRRQKLYTLNSCRLTLRHLGELQLLNRLADEVHALNQEQNRFLLADTTTLLHRLMEAGDASFVFEKLGASLRNVMIDEFQDTSRMQWDNFRLLLLEGLAQGADSLIVGDVKQSIYRWRGGDWNILNNLRENRGGALPDGVPYQIRVRTLDVNRRSEGHIIQFNNALFEQLIFCLNDRFQQRFKRPCDPLTQAYADVEQKSPRTEARGKVQVTFLTTKDKEDDYDTLTLKQLRNTLEELTSAGEALSRIAVLVRKNKDIPRIADYIDRELHLPVVSDEAFRLDASQAVCILVTALRVLNDATDHVALFTLVKEYCTAVCHSEASLDELLRGHPDELLPPDFVAQRDALRLMPLYELLETLYNLFGLSALLQQDAYVFAFLDAVSDYLQEHASDLQAFLDWWDERLCAKTIAVSGTEGLRICSIHKSKGLEFSHVIIPYCDWKLENETNDQLVWCSPSTAPYDNLPLVPVNYGSAMEQSLYQSDYIHELQQLWVDNINLLYVALTRARCNLFISSRAQSGTVGELLQQAVKRMENTLGTWDDSCQCFTLGTLLTVSTDSEQPHPSEANRLIQPSSPVPVTMQSLPHEVEFRQSNRSADFLAGRDADESPTRFIDRGRLLHALFATIRTHHDVEEALSRLLFEGIVADHELDELRTFVTHALHHPQVRAWYDGSWRLFNECDILWMEDGRLCSRRPDRVMQRADEWVVVDFKFGKPRPDHAGQVREYMQLLASMGYPTARMQGYLWYVGEEKVIRVS